jgi:uncharacterized repeat protein (TIGR03843 family)
VHQDERPQEALTLLASGEIELRGRMPWSSNGTFLVEVRDGEDAVLGVYKPAKGERPLWDFPPGLYRREAAAWALSELLGWQLIPETIVRDGPLGEGSVQRFVEADFEQHYFTLIQDPAMHDELRLMCAYDLLANNTDRKSGHCLVDAERHLWGIDQGLCFHEEPKIRTVIWEFGGEAIPDHALAAIERVLPLLGDALGPFLSVDEIAATSARGLRMLRTRRFPLADPEGRCYPWPMV